MRETSCITQQLQKKTMQIHKLFIILSFAMFFCVSCSEIINKKGKKGDFSFRKCTNCNILED